MSYKSSPSLVPVAIRMNSITLTVLVCVVLFIVISPVFSGKFPSNIDGCKRDDPKLNECVIKTVNSIVPLVYDGCKECGIPLLEPFDIKSILLSEKNNKGEGLDFKLENIKLKGFKNVRLTDSSKFNLKERNLELKIPLPYIILEGSYILDGRLLLLPIKGDGNANITFERMIVTYYSDLSINKGKDGKEHLHFDNTRANYTTEFFNLKLDNLFNGDKKLGDQMNRFLNENSNALLDEFDPVIRETIRSVITLVFNSITTTVPYDVLFPK